MKIKDIKIRMCRHKQPVMKNRNYKKHKKCDKIANDVMKNGILLGCHQGMNKSELKYICSTFKKLIREIATNCKQIFSFNFIFLFQQFIKFI